MRSLRTDGVQQLQGHEQLYIIRALQFLKGDDRMYRNASFDSNDSGLLLRILRTVRKPTWKKYLKILLMASDQGGTTMNEIADKLGEKPQSIHPLLKRMLEREALTRQKRGNEFFYHLTPNISKEEVQAQLEAIVDTDKAALLEVDEEESAGKKQVDDNQQSVENLESTNAQETLITGDRSSISQSEEKEKSLAKILIGKLPEFDPSWSEEVQAKWFASYERLISLGEKEDA